MNDARAPTDPRWLDAVILAAVVVAYGVALWDAASWTWAPLLIPVAAHASRLVWPRIPAWPVLLLTMAVVVSINIDLNAEGAFFLVCMGAFATAANGVRWLPERLVLAMAVLSPIVDAAAGSPAVRDWNWPFWSMGVAVSAAFGAVLFHQRRLTSSLREAQAQLARQAAGDERRRIAHEVHDLVGHSLTVVLLHLTGARRLVHRDPHEAERALAEAERAGRDSLREIRRTVALLREDGEGLQPTPAARDLDTLLAASRSAGQRIEADLPADLDDLDDTTGLAVYRIVQESLANAARHASGAPVSVSIRTELERLTIEIVNDGGGISTAEAGTGGTGIVGMQERAQALGGTLDAGPWHRGWRIRAELPRQSRSSEVAT